jgi:hypothetical protein
MSNTIKYSTGAETLALKSGNFYLGVNDVSKGPTSTTGYYNGITPLSVGYTIYQNKATQGPSIFTVSSDQELIDLTNLIAGASYTTVAQCLEYFVGQTDKMVVNKAYNTITTDGLIINFDASFSPSYPQTNTTWYDISVAGNNGTLTNGPAWNSSGYFDLDGSDDYINVPISNFPSSSFSVEVLIYKDAAGGYKSAAGIDVSNPVFPGLFYLQNADPTNEWVWHVYNTTGAAGFFISGGLTPIQKWFYSIGTFNGSTGTLYINGQSVGSQDFTGTLTTATGNLVVGAAWFNDTIADFWDGNIAYFRLYSKALSSAEVSQNYYGGPIVTDGLTFAVDASNLVSYENGSTTTYSLTGSLSGSLINGTGFSKGNGGTWVFDGTNDRINSNYGATLNDFTVCVWFRDDGSGQFGRVVDKNFQTGFWLGRNDNTANSWGGGILEDNPPYGRFLTLTDGQWHFLVSTRSGTTHTLYGDGITNTTSGTVSSSALSSTTLALGSESGTTTNPFKGNIAICYLYNRALTPSEILQNFNAQRSRFGI